jgi:carbon storage regulator
MPMLCLSRNRGESIMIGDDVKVTVIAIKGDRVRLGIEAPKEVPVHRQEVYLEIKAREKNREADAA